MFHEVLQTKPEIKYQFPPMDAVVVLGTSAHWDEQRREWRYPTIDPHSRKLWAGRARVIAASIVYASKLAPILLITGGREINGSDETERPEIFSEYLQSHYKVPENFIKTIGKKGTTMGNIQDVADYLEKHSELIKTGNIGILSNFWHLPRAILMGFKNPYFDNNSLNLIPIAAEGLLEQFPHYRNWVECEMKLPELAQALANETRGINALLDETYGLNK